MDSLSGHFFPLNKDTHCFLRISSSVHLGQTHVDNFAIGCFIINEDIDSLNPYTRDKLS